MRRRTAATEAPLEPGPDPTSPGASGPAPHDADDAGASAHPGHHKGARPPRTRPDASSLPGDAAVNLLSPWVMDELRVRTLQQRLVAGLVILLVVLGLGWAGLSFALSRDEASLRADEAQFRRGEILFSAQRWQQAETGYAAVTRAGPASGAPVKSWRRSRS